MSVVVQPTPRARPAEPAPGTSGPTSLARRLVLGREHAEAWVRPALGGVAALAAVLYFVNLTVSGYANTYYAMAAQAASQSWSAWFFGSLDASSFITIDKPPLATMVMGLSVRLLGLNSFAILAPQALMGVASVVVLFQAVRKSFGPVAATIAGIVMALAPVAVLIFRYDNPDALLVLLLVSAAWALLRALDRGHMRWLVVAGLLVGLGFNAKFLQAFLVLPAFALTWAVAAPGGLRRRIAGLAVSLASVLVTSFAWAVTVDLIPADARPYIGGSTGNSALQLLFGYDGLGRIFGGSAGNGGGGANFAGEPGILRLFNSQFGGEIAWLIPFALVALVAGLLLRGRAGRTDGPRAGYLLWGGWLVGTAIVFSFMSGTVHSYYAVALAPAIGALVGAGTVELWRLRERSPFGGLALGAVFVGSGLVAMGILDRTPAFVPGLGIAIVAVSAAAALVVGMPAAMSGRRAALAAATLGIAAMLAGPAAYATSTMASALSGGDPVAGPMTSGLGNGGPGGFGGGGRPASGGPALAGQAAMAGAGFGGSQGSSASSTLVGYLRANIGAARWAVAVSGSGSAAGIQLASGLPVMTMGGFNGGDAAPTLAQLQAFVASGDLRFVIVGGNGAGGGPMGGGPMAGGSSTGVSAWVTASCTLVDSATSGTNNLYDCAGAAGG